MEKYTQKNGITYELRGDYYYPMLELLEQTHHPIGKYGDLRFEFLKKHRRGTHSTLLTAGKLNEHLHETEQEAKRMLATLLPELVRSRGITEELKANDQLRWVAEMNNAKAAAEEIVFNEIIYI